MFNIYVYVVLLQIHLQNGVGLYLDRLPHCSSQNSIISYSSNLHWPLIYRLPHLVYLLLQLNSLLIVPCVSHVYVLEDTKVGSK